MRALEGLLVNLWRGIGAVAIFGPRPTGRAAKGGRPIVLPTLRTFTVLALTTSVLLVGASAARANEAQTILEKCGHKESVSGYSQSAYREALKQMPTILIEYSFCTEQIRNAELAAAGGGGPTSAGSSPNVSLALTPTEQHAVQSAHHNGGAPVQVGNEPIRPGVVHADIASAVNTLPHSLFAVLAFLLASALGLTIGEVLKRVRARRNG